MKIFISWSGLRSGAVAKALQEYLPMINNAFDPWLSSVSIDKGSRSTAEIAEALATAKAGIICLTPNNLKEPWILFEAGGVAKTVAKPLACTLLVDLRPSDVEKPLGDFQHTLLAKNDLLQLMKTLNKAAGETMLDEAKVEKAFNLCWPELQPKLENLPIEDSSRRPQRTSQDLLAEVLDTTRAIQQETGFLRSAEQSNSGGIAEILSKLSNLQPTFTVPIQASGFQGPGNVRAAGSSLNVADLLSPKPGVFGLTNVPGHENAFQQGTMPASGSTRKKFAHASKKRVPREPVFGKITPD
jgi:hypothetical protein